MDSLVGDCKRLLSLSILMVIKENVSTNVKGQNELPVAVFGIAGGKLDCQPRGRVSLIAGLDSPLEHGTGTWDWIV